MWSDSEFAIEIRKILHDDAFELFTNKKYNTVVIPQPDWYDFAAISIPQTQYAYAAVSQFLDEKLPINYWHIEEVMYPDELGGKVSLCWWDAEAGYLHHVDWEFLMVKYCDKTISKEGDFNCSLFPNLPKNKIEP